MSFVILCISGLIEVLANAILVKSNGFKRYKLGILALILVVISFLLLSTALSMGIKLSVAYVLWGSIGIIGSVVTGFFLKQRLRLIGYIGIVLILVAVVILKS
ncbi:ligand-binding protein SH3 [Helicobacter sp. 13S00401-1]|uniref:SMR family transporter n=1 Tax=Helicobacter sp. 13S00401-1 TaxID=1905758 RepID=UPI000BA50C0F|nr:SMR family transporter [Helicobacter sp. 13S00401-1]PAF51438.1 ligand-binding protein SH3 [Helicobacter sp. 13S00401-1]